MLKIFFSQAMDFVEKDIVINKYTKFCEILSNYKVEISTGIVDIEFQNNNLDFKEISKLIVEKDLEKIRQSDLLFVDMSIPNRNYIGCNCEIVYAYIEKIPIIVYIGNTDNGKRYWLNYHSTFVSNSFEKCIERIYNYVNCEKN